MSQWTCWIRSSRLLSTNIFQPALNHHHHKHNQNGKKKRKLCMLMFLSLFNLFNHFIERQKCCCLHTIAPDQAGFLTMAFWYMTQSILRDVPQTRRLWSAWKLCALFSLATLLYRANHARFMWATKIRIR